MAVSALKKSAVCLFILVTLLLSGCGYLMSLFERVQGDRSFDNQHMPYPPESITGVFLRQNAMSIFDTYQFQLDRDEKAAYFSGHFTDERGSFTCESILLTDADLTEVTDAFLQQPYDYILAGGKSAAADGLVLDETVLTFQVTFSHDPVYELHRSARERSVLQGSAIENDTVLDVFKALTVKYAGSPQ